MKRDLRDDSLHGAVAEHFRRVHEPGLGRLADAADVRISHDERFIAVAGALYDSLRGVPHSRIALYDSANASMNMIGTAGNGGWPRWAPARNDLAFVSDHESPGRMRVYIVDAESSAVRAVAADLQGSAESLSWSPDGHYLLIQTAALGADRPGAMGSGTVHRDDEVPEWTPHVEHTIPDEMWRTIWMYSLKSGSLRACGPKNTTFWEAEWCGNDGIVAVVSDDPREGAWHEARLVYLSRDGETFRTIYRPHYEIGVPVASADGECVAIIEGSCSDRTIVSGNVVLLDRRAGWRAQTLDAVGFSVTALAVRKGNGFSFAGIRGFDVLAGEIDVPRAAYQERWSSHESAMRRYPAVAPAGSDGYVTVAHAYGSAPKLVRFGATEPRTVLHDFAHEGTRYVAHIGGELTALTWQSRDGIDIQGYLTKPAGPGPHPLVVLVHGGPVWAYMNSWQMHTPLTPLLVSLRLRSAPPQSARKLRPRRGVRANGPRRCRRRGNVRHACRRRDARA